MIAPLVELLNTVNMFVEFVYIDDDFFMPTLFAVKVLTLIVLVILLYRVWALKKEKVPIKVALTFFLVFLAVISIPIYVWGIDNRLEDKKASH